MAFKNFKVETDADGITLVTWDIPGRSMNVLDTTTTEELGAIVQQTTSDAAIKGVVLTSAKEAFCAGADLTMLEGMNRTYAKILKQKGEEGPPTRCCSSRAASSSQTFRAIETSRQAVGRRDQRPRARRRL